MFDELLRYKKDTKYFVFDIETYNLCLNFAFNVPWELGFIKTEGFKIVNEQNIVINWLNEKPNLLIEDEVARKVHYDKNKILSEGLEPLKAFEIFYPYLEQADIILTHNGIGFDFNLLKEYCLYAKKNWKLFVNKLMDTNALARGLKSGNIFDPKKENILEYQIRLNNTRIKGVKTKLGILCAENGISYDENIAHNALYDAQKTWEVWKKLIWQVEI